MDPYPGEAKLTLLRVRLRRDASGYPPYDSEQVLADEVGDHLFRLAGVPVFARGLAFGDVVEARHYGLPEQLWVERVDVESGHSTVRVVLLGESKEEEIIQLANDFGCQLGESPIAGLFALDVAPPTDVAGLVAALRLGRSSGLWDYDVGVAARSHGLLIGAGVIGQ